MCIKVGTIHITEVIDMRTNILIDDLLMTQALKASGLTTKRAAVEAGLRCSSRFIRRWAFSIYAAK
jgi:Arc/MetJ family transcription regulator